MDVLPAIDLIGGKCVRLVQGEYDKQITYKDDPVEQAREFVAAGSDWLHIIDLEGAKSGKIVNGEAIRAIVDADLGLKIEVGGGVRDEEAIKELLGMGIERAIIGTSAITQWDWFCETAEKYPGKLVLGLDARGAHVATEGWLEEGEDTIWDFAARADNLPLAAIIYTDISKDGMLEGPNLERTKALVDAVRLDVVAAGGVTKVEDVVALKEIGAAGAIIGRAIYEGEISLKAAIAASRLESRE